MKKTVIGDVTYLGEIDACNECGSTENLIDHHVQYEPEEIIKVLCQSCHIKYHKRNPDDRRPERFDKETTKAHKNKWTTISLQRTTKRDLMDYGIDIGMKMGTSWDDFLKIVLRDAEEGRGLKRRYKLK